MPFHSLLLLLLLLVVVLLPPPFNSFWPWPPILPPSAAAAVALPGCQDRCGPVPVPYPFGIGPSRCYRDNHFQILCNASSAPPKPFLAVSELELLDVSTTNGLVRVNGPIASSCHTDLGEVPRRSPIAVINVDGSSPYTVSHARNSLVVIGCNSAAFVTDRIGANYTGGCMAYCGRNMSAPGRSCYGIGCCMASVPEGEKLLAVAIVSVPEEGSCSYAFVADNEWFRLEASHKSGSGSFNFNRRAPVPVALDWGIGGERCAAAQEGGRSVACSRNSYCYDPENGAGYRCKCYDGFLGNPYLPDGCQDFDECADPKTNPCSNICKNTPGSYCCSCPLGTTGDGRKNGTGCIPLTSAAAGKNDFPVLELALGGGLGLLFLLMGSSWLHWGLKKRKLVQLRQKYFEQNGGLLLQQQLAAHDRAVETAKVFTAEELNKATQNYDDSRILGDGGYGTVYKGVLPDNKVVAIKKSKIVDETQIEQFINEVVVLTQINHKNVVKLLGCCLETPVPMLVYEFITNGTLSHHIHDKGNACTISWENRLRIAADTAGALAYLHSAASTPIIHRDIKSTNILLDDNYTAKVSDFGASRLVPLDQTKLNTLVQGTLGYLDPEYFQTGQLSEKSDVYSFGIVLVELLTGKIPLNPDRPEAERNLAMHFILSMRSNNLFKILQARVVKEGRMEELQSAAELAKRCLTMRGEERPTMKEVAMELERLRRAEKNTCIQEENTEAMNILIQLSETDDSSINTGYDSMKSQMPLLPLDTR